MKRGALVVLVAGTVAAIPAVDAAAEYTITTCYSDRGAHSSDAFEEFATRGMQGTRRCSPEGDGLRGLMTANVPRNGRVERGARSFFVLRAPEGTRFSKFTWSGQARRRDCRYALQLWAGRPDGPPVSIKNVKANSGCPKPGRAQAAGWPRPRTYDVGGATMIAQRTVCVGAHGKPFCSARGLNYIRTFRAEATVVDVTPPAVSILQDNPFTRGEWVRGPQMVNYDASDNVGVRVGTPFVNGVVYPGQSRACNYALRVPCINGPGAVELRTTTLAEGSQPLVIQAEDSAGNATQSTPVTIRVDNTAPSAVAAAVEGGDGWRNVNGMDVSWTNPPEPDRAPMVAAHYRLCRANGQQCSSGRQAALGISRLASLNVPGPGEWELRLWREDAAANQEPGNASLPVLLRFDPDAPRIAFQEPDPADPTLVTVRAEDDVSGVASGEIELSREGSGLWQALPTTFAAGRLSGRIDDQNLPPGVYRVRAFAADNAANMATVDTRPDGQPALLALPLRTRTTLKAGFVTRVRSRPHSRENGRRRSDGPRPRPRMGKSRARVSAGREFRVEGALKDDAGNPIANTAIGTTWTTHSGSPEATPDVHTDARGRFTYVDKAPASGVLRFSYGGSARTLPSGTSVTLVVPARTSAAVRPGRVVNGRAVRFDGRLHTLPVPAAGKLVELQVVLSGRWQTFRTLRTNSDGTWVARYRFRRSCGHLRYRFRVRLPAEAGYPFAKGHSRPMTVLVRGRPCR